MAPKTAKTTATSTTRSQAHPKTMLEAPTEAQEQRWLVKWLMMHPILKEFVVKLNNEGKRTPIQGHQLKLLGMHPGASDLFIAYPAHGRSGLWLEIKKNRLYTASERDTATWIAQARFIALMRSVGFSGDFCYGWEHAKVLVDDYLAGRI